MLGNYFKVIYGVEKNGVRLWEKAIWVDAENPTKAEKYAKELFSVDGGVFAILPAACSTWDGKPSEHKVCFTKFRAGQDEENTVFKIFSVGGR